MKVRVSTNKGKQWFEVKQMKYGYVYCLYPQTPPNYQKQIFKDVIVKISEKYISWKSVLGKIINDNNL